MASVAPLPRAGVPWVLLDDARPGGSARLYVDPVCIMHSCSGADVPAVLRELRAATAGGLHAAGFLSYEAGFALQPGLTPLDSAGLPLVWFGLFRDVRALDIAAALPGPEGAWSGAPHPMIDRSEHRHSLARVQDYIAAGDIYQANLTFQATVPAAGDPLALYAALRARSAAGHGAIVCTGDDWLLSLSPELFFDLHDGRLTARPMKGTAARASGHAADTAQVAALATSPKQRAENLMIVDLLRNDLSRVAAPGSVAVPRLFEVETYPSLHQLTSTVTARLAPGYDAVDALTALFPCGSITGAPKRRAMEVLAEIEDQPRGIYTGSIGRIDAGGTNASFNVAIRTLHLPVGGETATLGLGSGIIAASEADDEWRECLAKGAFVASDRPFDLVETMAFTPDAGLARLDAHLRRLQRSAKRFGFTFDRHRIRNELQAATFRLRRATRVRLLLARSGAIAIEVRDAPVAAGPLDVVLAPRTVANADFRLAHKTTDRGYYDRCGAPGGETVYLDPDGFVTEGSYMTVFVERAGQLLTPPLTRGILPGVLRQELLDTGRAVEGELRAHDLADGFLLGNALRGLLPARLLTV